MVFTEKPETYLNTDIKIEFTISSKNKDDSNTELCISQTFHYDFSSLLPKSNLPRSSKQNEEKVMFHCDLCYLSAPNPYL